MILFSWETREICEVQIGTHSIQSGQNCFFQLLNICFSNRNHTDFCHWNRWSWHVPRIRIIYLSVWCRGKFCLTWGFRHPPIYGKRSSSGSPFIPPTHKSLRYISQCLEVLSFSLLPMKTAWQWYLNVICVKLSNMNATCSTWQRRCRQAQWLSSGLWIPLWFIVIIIWVLHFWECECPLNLQWCLNAHLFKYSLYQLWAISVLVLAFPTRKYLAI